MAGPRKPTHPQWPAFWLLLGRFPLLGRLPLPGRPDAEAGRLTAPLALDTERPSACPLPTERMPPLDCPDGDRPSCLPPAPPEPGRTLPLLLLRLRVGAAAARASDQTLEDAASGCPAAVAAEGAGEGLGGTGAPGRLAANASDAAWSGCHAAGVTAAAATATADASDAPPRMPLARGGDALSGPAGGPPASSTLAAAALEGLRNLAGSEPVAPADAVAGLAAAVLGRWGLRLPGMPLLVAGLAGSGSAWTEPLPPLRMPPASAAVLPSCSSPLRPACCSGWQSGGSDCRPCASSSASSRRQRSCSATRAACACAAAAALPSAAAAAAAAAAVVAQCDGSPRSNGVPTDGALTAATSSKATHLPRSAPFSLCNPSKALHHLFAALQPLLQRRLPLRLQPLLATALHRLGQGSRQPQRWPSVDPAAGRAGPAAAQRAAWPLVQEAHAAQPLVLLGRAHDVLKVMLVGAQLVPQPCVVPLEPNDLPASVGKGWCSVKGVGRRWPVLWARMAIWT
jgi:hypothetical protein